MALPRMGPGRFWLYICTGALLGTLFSCSPTNRTGSPDSNATQGAPSVPSASAPGTVEDYGLTPSADSNPGETPQVTASTGLATAEPLSLSSPQPVHPVGTGLRKETLPILFKYQGCPGMVMTGSSQMAEMTFFDLNGWVRVLGAPSLAELEKKAKRAAEQNLPYEALAYGLETGPTTPDEEWQDPVEATKKAGAIADAYGKLLILGPGERLMLEHPENYAPMAALSDLWVFQTQMYQKDLTLQEYRRSVENVIMKIREGNPEIGIWAQIVLPPDREPSPEYWLEYRDQILTLVDGTFVGVYTWMMMEPDSLVGTIDSIFAAVCGEE